MPASAHHHGDQNTSGAQVIDFAARSSARRVPSPAAPCPSVPGPVPPAPGPFERESPAYRDPRETRDIVTVIERMMDAHRVSLADPTAQATIAAMADFLEQVVLGAWKLREGSEADGIVGDPGRGVDRVGAQTLMDVLRDVRCAPSDLAAITAAAREL
jgi:hypothetical protein